MTEAKAKEILLYFLNRLDGVHYLKNGVLDPAAKVEAFSLALAALEKRIPKKPRKQKIIVYSVGTRCISGECPDCGQVVSAFASIKTREDKTLRRDEDYFCNYCGQALDWSDYE